MADGSDQVVEAPAARRGPAAARRGGHWSRIGLALAGLACLGAAGAAGWRVGIDGVVEYRKVYLYQPMTANITECEAPWDELPEQPAGPGSGQGQPVRQGSSQGGWHPGRAAYEFVLGDRLYTGEYVTASPNQRKCPTGYEIELIGPEDVGGEITVYYDPADPRCNTVEPVADIQLAVVAILALPVLAWGVAMLVLALLAGSDAPPRESAAPILRELICYSGLSVAGAVGLHLGAPRMPWERAWMLALGLAGVGVPLASVVAAALAGALGRRIRPIAMGRLSEAGAAGEGGAPGEAKAPGEAHAPGEGALVKAAAAAPGLGGMWATATMMMVGGLLVAGLSAHLASQSAWRQWVAAGRLQVATGTILSSGVGKVAVEAAEGPPPAPAAGGPAGSAAGPVFRYRLIVTSLYKVGSKEYSTGRLAREPVDFADELVAKDIADRKYPRGKPVTVYYDPADPAAGVLLPRLPGESPQRLVAAPLAILSGLLIAVWGASLPRSVRRVREFLDRPFDPPCRIPSLGVLRPTPDGLELHRRRSPIMTAWLGYAAVAGLIFAAATWRQQRTGETMSLAAVIYGTVSCFCAAAACGLLVARQSKLRLVLDTQNRLLLAGAGGRQFSLSFDLLAAWTVSWADDFGDAAAGGVAKKPPRDRVPILGIRTKDGQQAKIHLFRGPALWTDRFAAARKTAEELAKITECDADAVGAE